MVQLSTPGVTPNWGMPPPCGAFCQITLTTCYVYRMNRVLYISTRLCSGHVTVIYACRRIRRTTEKIATRLSRATYVDVTWRKLPAHGDKKSLDRSGLWLAHLSAARDGI